MRVVVAGGAGFLGTHLCQALLQRGDEVVVVDNFITGSKRNVESLADRPGFSFEFGDVIDGVSIDGAVDAVMNLASPASPADFAVIPIQILQVGSAGTKNLLDLALAKNARFFQASTSEVYGDPEEHPQSETYWGHVNPIGPRSVYDEAKRFGEALTMAYHRTHGLDVRMVRIFNTYGPYMRPDDGRVVSNFINQALLGKPLTVYGDGSQTRSFCYATDEVAGFLAVLDSDYVGPINVGNPTEFTVLELARMVLDITGSRSEIAFVELPADDPTQRCPDITLARRLGWQPRVPLRRGIEQTAAWFQAQLDGGE
ncbi:MAG: dTDP-glucose 4,6-dehydratase [Acidimicrobiaceae bacterium]|nr:dTDP-glucose 4,6-dehydratase [Acidimicrobiaceae bacterium]